MAEPREGQNLSIKERAVEKGFITVGGRLRDYWIVPNGAQAGGPFDLDKYPDPFPTTDPPIWAEGDNGYIVVPIDDVGAPCQEEIDVHGGCTYLHRDEEGLVYGFDTMHSFSSDMPINRKDWILEEIKRMAASIMDLQRQARREQLDGNGSS